MKREGGLKALNRFVGKPREGGRSSGGNTTISIGTSGREEEQYGAGRT